MKKFTLIIDFDSTFVTVEGLDELSKICLLKNPNRREIIRKIENITCLGMEGKIIFSESLSRRLNLFKPQGEEIDALVRLLQKKISPSIQKNRKFFLENSKNIYIISGGFKEWINPVVKDFAIPKSNILANEFIFNDMGEIIDYDHHNLLSQEKGKVKQVRELHLHGDVCVLGDGITDYEIRKANLADYFFAYTENIKRPEIVAMADGECKNLDQFLDKIR